jgi:hypothetical protein
MVRPEPKLIDKTRNADGSVRALVRMPFWYGPTASGEVGHYKVLEVEVLSSHRPRFDKGSDKRSPSWPFLKKVMGW